AAALRTYLPTRPDYVRLRDALASARARAKGDLPAIADGPTLRVGDRDPAVAVLRARLGAPAPVDLPAQVFDETLARRLAAYQRERRLAPTGALDPRTREALDGDRRGPTIRAIVASMEMLRWTPRPPATDGVEVNVPEYRLRVRKAGATVDRQRVAVGAAATPTPLFASSIRYAIFNPTWFVPQSIVRRDIAPKLAADPGYLHKAGFVGGRRGGYLAVSQPPGPDNALGRVAYMLPNRHLVFFHDSPDRALLATVPRALSHGCVRLSHPFAMAAFAFGGMPGWSAERARALIGAREQSVVAHRQLSVEIIYLAARVDAAGRLRRFADVYGYQARVEALLDGDRTSRDDQS
ncbi:MAG: L,D-transpeptidase family protein, partial [Hyphomicrobiales bacterium]|nr:L,D-transpeptidase family protein [Hyphomicrobiales bacterium]